MSERNYIVFTWTCPLRILLVFLRIPLVCDSSSELYKLSGITAAPATELDKQQQQRQQQQQEKQDSEDVTIEFDFVNNEKITVVTPKDVIFNFNIDDIHNYTHSHFKPNLERTLY